MSMEGSLMENGAVDSSADVGARPTLPPYLAEYLKELNIEYDTNQYAVKRYGRKLKHGITDEIWDAQLLIQDHICWFCDSTLIDKLGSKATNCVVCDHDESNNKNRAIVHAGCNIFIEHLIRYFPTHPWLLNYLGKIKNSSVEFINSRVAKKYHGNVKKSYYLHIYPNHNSFVLRFTRGRVSKNIYHGAEIECFRIRQKIIDELKPTNFLDLAADVQVLIVHKYKKQYAKYRNA